MTGLLDELLAEQLDGVVPQAAPEPAPPGKGLIDPPPPDLGQLSGSSAACASDARPAAGEEAADISLMGHSLSVDADLEGLLSDIERRREESEVHSAEQAPLKAASPLGSHAAGAGPGGAPASPASQAGAAGRLAPQGQGTPRAVGAGPGAPPPPPRAELPCAWELQLGGATEAIVSHAEDPNKCFRSYMEDGHKVLEPLPVPGCSRDESWSFFAVFDGHGGRSEVDYCQQHLQETLVTELQSNRLDPCKALEATFLKIDSQLAMLGAWNSGCTVTVMLLHRQASSSPALSLYVANVGDSRAVLVGAREAYRLTKDHRPDDPSEAARIEADGGRVHNRRVSGKLGVARSLGDHHLKNAGVSAKPDTFAYEVSHGHVLVVASDGLWDVLGDQDAHGVLQVCMDGAVEQCGGQQGVKETLQETAAQALLDRAKQLGSRDNILVLVIFI